VATRRRVTTIGSMTRAPLALSLFLMGCGDDGATTDESHPDPMGHSTPEAEGMDSARLAALLIDIKAANLDLHSLLVARHGKIVLDAKFFPYDGVRPHDIASCTKSLTSSAIGIALSSGELDSLDSTLLSFFPEHATANDSAEKRALTLSHALSMTSGFDCVNTPTELTLIQMQSSADWVGFALDVPMAGPPGESFRYCSTAMHALSGVITSATGEPLDRFLDERLFQPIHAASPEWPTDPQGVSHGWGDARLTPEALARVGQLWLEQGSFGGEQLIGADYLELATKNQTADFGPPAGYGYGFWMHSGETFSADGRGGQHVFVLPALDIVLVTTGSQSPEQEANLLQLVQAEGLASVSDTTLAPNPSAQAELDQTIVEVAAPPAPGPVPNAPAIAALVSGKSHLLEPNVLGWNTVSLVLGATEATLEVSMGSFEVEASIGLDGVPRITRGVRFAEMARYLDIDLALSGRWLDAATFELTFSTIDTIDAGTIRFEFADASVTLVLYEKTFIRSEIVIEGNSVSSP
jgi:CubicO group peptidase (beta-lactamase class C family)